MKMVFVHHGKTGYKRVPHTHNIIRRPVIPVLVSCTAIDKTRLKR